MVSSSAKATPTERAFGPPADAEAPEALSLVQSPIGKKLLTGLTGLGMVAFVVFHMLGNLTLFAGAAAYNQLAHRIEGWGPLLLLAEFVLLGAVCLHAAIGISIYWGKRQARPVNYTEYESAGDPSRQTTASRTMIFSGALLAGFLIWHLATFKFGTVYSVPNSGNRDLARLVFETFHQPFYTASYVIILSFLGLHLRHGIWSALQSFGIATKPSVVVVSAVISSAIALGFIGLPLAIYFHLIG